MNDYRAYVECDYNSIYHFGVKGMKWGVRRYQNYDGSYTQKGLARYHKAEADYDKAESEYKSLKDSGDKEGMRSAKDRMKFAERNMRKEYKDLKRHKMADEGKKLYQRGETISGNSRAEQMARLAVGAVGALNVMADPDTMKWGQDLARTYGYDKVQRTRKYVLAGQVAAAALLLGKGIRDDQHNKKLRAYYAH